MIDLIFSLLIELFLIDLAALLEFVFLTVSVYRPSEPLLFPAHDSLIVHLHLSIFSIVQRSFALHGLVDALILFLIVLVFASPLVFSVRRLAS